MFSRAHRLPANIIPIVLRKGIRIRRLTIEWTILPAVSGSRFAVIVPLKTNRRATGRNRMKRLVREAIVHMLPEIIHHADAVCVVRGRLPDSESEVETYIRAAMRESGML